MKLRLVFFCLLGRVLAGHDHYNFNASEFNYRDISEWARKYPECGLSGQSPININPAEVIMDSSLPRLIYGNYDLMIENLHVENGGHTITFHIPPSYKLDIIKGGLEGVYELKQFHFHWAQENNLGSEHTIHGLHFPLELHLVHYKKGIPPETAASTPNGIAVLSVLYLLHEDGVPLSEVTAALGRLEKFGDNTTLSYIHLGHLLPKDRGPFYRYHGSLTTPPCSESVIWTVLANPQHVDATEMGKFRKLRNIRNEILQRNYRPVQPISGRKIYLRNTNIPACSESNSADSTTAQLLLIYVTLALVYCLDK